MNVGSSPTSPDRLAIFAFLWAGAALFHQASYGAWTASPTQFAVSLAALLVCIRPSSTVLLLILAACQLVEAITSLPWLSNHWLLTAWVNATLLAAAVSWNRNARDAGRDGLFDGFAPSARACVLVLYFFVVFHKLNTSFLQPEVSCATLLLGATLGSAQVLLDSPLVGHLAIYGTLAFESAIPLMLCFPATRYWGILLGLFFHLVLSLNPAQSYYNFSAVTYALLALWAPRPFFERLAIALSRLGARFHAPPWNSLPLAAAAPTCAGIFLAGVGLGIIEPRNDTGARLIWSGFAVGALFAWIRFAPAEGEGFEGSRALLLAGPRLLLVFPALLFLNGSMPYLGLKTETSLAMYSNLRTEANGSNHLIIGRPLYLADYQLDLARVIESDHPGLQRHADAGTLLTFFELQRVAAAIPEARLAYERNGVPVTAPRIRDDPALEPPPHWLRKLLSFRPVPQSQWVPCTH